ncbi:hypothetical protein B0186_11170 [Canicola haemoglobinophilus]|uniref:Uncharacterized protein n=1 Tax=Canicola haemoglobinophilus TaxID=733 RepID=A0A1V4AYC6_9PAST|nr:hypothetical protein [Canicola haemoglobinophilus]OOR96047.1 hypothetical protein B0186_11170 [Canicola haemoglobinophilus]STO59246.1 Uncharacterised protein [Canicola haemoglobinophilus]
MDEKEAIQVTIDIFYRLTSLELIEFQIKQGTIKENIVDLIHHIDDMDIFGGWFWYFYPTEKGCDLIDKFNLYDNHYDEETICKDFCFEFVTLLKEKGLDINIYPLVDIGWGGAISLN